MAGRVARFSMWASVALTLAALVSSSAGASVGPEGPRLAVVENTLFPYRFDLTTVDETGAQPLRLAGGGPKKRPLPEEFTLPSWSPDGSMVVFVALSGRLDQGQRAVRLYVSSSDGSELKPLRGTRGADEPKFAPDGRTVFFTRYRFRSRVNGRGKKELVVSGASIWAIDVFGGSARRITPERNGVWMYAGSFSPDGEDLLASRLSRRGSWSVVKINLTSEKTSVLLHRAADPVYSPDGSRVAFVRWRNVHRRGGRSESRSDLFRVPTGFRGSVSLNHEKGRSISIPPQQR